MRPLTPSQTIGPFFALSLSGTAVDNAHGLVWADGAGVVADGVAGALWLRGRILDGAGELVTDALVETWQADVDGRHAGGADPGTEGFRGLGRVATDAQGRFALRTVKPGRVPGPGGALQAPHVAVSVFARGLLDRLVTRVYFADEQAANAEDPVLAAVPADRRHTLLAAPGDDGYVLDLRLQGPGETVFFDV